MNNELYRLRKRNIIPSVLYSYLHQRLSCSKSEESAYWKWKDTFSSFHFRKLKACSSVLFSTMKKREKCRLYNRVVRLLQLVNKARPKSLVSQYNFFVWVATKRPLIIYDCMKICSNILQSTILAWWRIGQSSIWTRSTSVPRNIMICYHSSFFRITPLVTYVN